MIAITCGTHHGASALILLALALVAAVILGVSLAKLLRI